MQAFPVLLHAAPQVLAAVPVQTNHDAANRPQVLTYTFAAQARQTEGVKTSELRGFQLFLQAYAFNPKADAFEAILGMPPHLPGQINQALDALRRIDTEGASSPAYLPSSHDCNIYV